VTHRLYAYAHPLDPEAKVYRWFPKDGAPATVLEQDVDFELVPDKPRDTTQAFKCIREGFRSISLPRWWPYARYHDKGGACVFENETEALEAVKRARDAGEPVSWDR